MSDNNRDGKFDGMLTDKDEAVDGETYIVPNYVETKLTKERRQECRDIVKTINQFVISQRQRLFLIYLLALELENNESMHKIAKVIGECKDTIEDSKVITISSEDKLPAKKLILTG